MGGLYRAGSLSLSFGNGITVKINLEPAAKAIRFTRVITRRQTATINLCNPAWLTALTGSKPVSPVIYQNSCPGSLTILNDLEICFLPISLSLFLFISSLQVIIILLWFTRVLWCIRTSCVSIQFFYYAFSISFSEYLCIFYLYSPTYILLCLFPFSFIFVSNVLLQRGIGLIIALIFKHHRSSRRYSSIPWDRVAGGGEGERERETGHWQSGTLMPINYVLGTTCTLLPPSLQHLRLGCWLVFIDIMLAYVVYISYRSIGTSRYILARLVWRMPPNCEHCPDR